MSLDPDLLYSWLPAHVRVRDQEEGEPLRALLSVVEQVCNGLHDDIGSLYRNWFIETAQEWVVPYMGDLVGSARLRAMSPRAYTLRAHVANAIALRRRKGAPAALEQVAEDVSGWHASVLEMFQNVSTTQHIKHPRPLAVRTPALRSADEMARLHGPFERACHTLDVRGLNRDPAPRMEPPPPQVGPISVLTRSDRGRYNLQTVSLFLYRLRAWPVTLAPAAVHNEAAFRWYHFDQLGRDLPLFNFPQTKLEPASLAEEHHLPGRLRRSALFQELEARRQAEGQAVPAWFGDKPPFRIYVRTPGAQNGQDTLEEIDPSEILIADLGRCAEPGWIRPPNARSYFLSSGGSIQKPIVAVVDPELGRLIFTEGNEPAEGQEVLVSYHYGFSADLGGGTYGRRADLPERAGFSRYEVRREAGGERALQNQIERWLAEKPNTPGAVIEILDNFVYSLDLGPSVVPEGKHLEIRAADRQRPVIVLRSNLRVELPPRASLTLNGLWIHGGDVEVTAGGPATISLIHCTLVPRTQFGPGSRLRITAPSGAPSPLAVSCIVHRSITGALDLSALGPGCALEIEDSIVDHRDEAELAIHHGGALRARASTVLGRTRVDVLELASDMLFTGLVMSERRQAGAIRFSYAPPGSELPPRFQCQPPLVASPDQLAVEAMLHRQKPRFTSVEHGQPGYCQLAVDMPDEILRGASDEGEMGVMNHLEQSHRALNLRAALTEHLCLGLEAGIIFVT